MDLYKRFIEALVTKERSGKFSNTLPGNLTSEPGDKSWQSWKPYEGTASETIYRELERKFNIILPASFINWHRSYFFLDGDCWFIRLPAADPSDPLGELRTELDWFIPQQLIPQKLYPFADEGNDTGPFVFDGRVPVDNNEFPIRVYDHEFGGDPEGLSEIVFSSFTRLIECVTHFLTEKKSRKDYEIIPDFFRIDPEGAGETGITYWNNWIEMWKANESDE